MDVGSFAVLHVRVAAEIACTKSSNVQTVGPLSRSWRELVTSSARSVVLHVIAVAHVKRSTGRISTGTSVCLATLHEPMHGQHDLCRLAREFRRTSRKDQ